MTTALVGNYLNIADSLYEDWADQEVIDILVPVYGDSAVLAPDGNPRNFNFLTGTLPEINFPLGGSIPVECRNREWNWILFRIDNGIRGSDGSRFVGSIPANAQGGTTFAGVNGGTIRFEGEAAPMQMAVVEIAKPDGSDPDVKVRQDGRFVFDGLAAGEYRLRARSISGGAWGPPKVVRASPDGIERVELVVPK